MKEYKIKKLIGLYLMIFALVLFITSVYLEKVTIEDFAPLLLALSAFMLFLSHVEEYHKKEIKKN